jgi:hypothetical protein
MKPHLLLTAVSLALACRADDPAGVPADCTRAEPVQLITGTYQWLDTVHRAGDATFFAVQAASDPVETHVGPACGADPVLLAEGARLYPTRIAFDPQDDEPTLVCDQDNDRHYRVDLSGERPPQLLLPYLSCLGRPTRYGPLFIGGSGYLRLFQDFPDDTTATATREQGGNDVFLLDEWIVYTHAADLHAYRFSTGETIDIPGHVLGFAGSGDHVLWYDYEDIATVTLVDLRTNTPTVLGTFDRDAAWDVEQYIPGFSHSTWGFDPSGRYVYHLHAGLPAEAFDLAGRPVALPAPGEVVWLLDDGVVSVTRDDGQLHVTRPRDATATPLDGRLAATETARDLVERDGHLEKITDGDLVRIDLGGAPARVLARDVGHLNHWLTDRVLVTLHDDRTLERIDTTTGERTRLATDVLTAERLGDALYILRTGSPDPADDGVWYLSPETLDIPADDATAARAAPRRPTRDWLTPPPP